MGMKEFLENKMHFGGIGGIPENGVDGEFVFLNDLFVFLWERGGIEFALHYKMYSFGEIKRKAKQRVQADKLYVLQAQDFLDCVAIDKERAKELRKELKYPAGHKKVKE